MASGAQRATAGGSWPPSRSSGNETTFTPGTTRVAGVPVPDLERAATAARPPVHLARCGVSWTPERSRPEPGSFSASETWPRSRAVAKAFRGRIATSAARDGSPDLALLGRSRWHRGGDEPEPGRWSKSGSWRMAFCRGWCETSSALLVEIGQGKQPVEWIDESWRPKTAD